MAQNTDLYIGMLSGTSRDGVDAALVRFDGEQPHLIESLCLAYPQPLQDRLRIMVDRRQRPGEDEMALVDAELAEVFALAVWTLLDQSGIPAREITAIGSHGQTVWHNPTGTKPESIQLGDPQHIANLSCIPTVGQFRQADLDAGGQGAPLAPLLHGSLLMPENGVSAVLNVGGISNISILQAEPDEASPKQFRAIRGHDTGPGNCLLDAWIRKHKGSEFDESGQWAAGGTVDEDLLELLLSDPYFELPAPKSTGVEYFNLHWLQSRLQRRDVDQLQASFRDIQATLSELTARSIAQAVTHCKATELLICGGGAHNLDLLKRLQSLLPDVIVETTATRGIDPDLMESILFAWLAKERIARRPQDTHAITGAREPVLLGEVFDPT